MPRAIRREVLYLRAIKKELAEMVIGVLFTVSGFLWQIAQWIRPTLAAPAFAPWMLYIPGIGMLAVASFKAWNKEYERATAAEAKLLMTRPLFLAKLHDIHKVDVDPLAITVLPDPEFMLRLILEIEPHRHTARNVRG